MTGSRSSVPGTDDVVRAVHRHARTAPAETALRIQVLGSGTPDPTVCLDENERSSRTPVSEISSWIASRSPGMAWRAPAALDAAVSDWIASRPVADDDAFDAGVACLNRTGDRIGWEVVVVRAAAPVPWHPSPACGRERVESTRRAALARSRLISVRMWSDGEAAIWRCDDAPELTCAVLSDPRRMLGQMAAHGLVASHPRFVVSPPGAVACAPAAAAARLAAEVAEPHVVLSLEQIDRLEWL